MEQAHTRSSTAYSNDFNQLHGTDSFRTRRGERRSPTDAEACIVACSRAAARCRWGDVGTDRGRITHALNVCFHERYDDCKDAQHDEPQHEDVANQMTELADVTQVQAQT